MNDLTNKNILITGAAQGIGLGITKHALKNNASVIMLDSNNDLLEETSDALKSTHEGKVFNYNLDLMNDHAYISVINNFHNEFDKILIYEIPRIWQLFRIIKRANFIIK